MRSRTHPQPAVLVCTLALLVLIGCTSDTPVSTGGVGSSISTASSGRPGVAADSPGDLVEITCDGNTLALWPYFSPNGERLEDPANLVFVGNASALQIRAALLALDGNRPGFPPVFPFTARWSEAMGGVQAGYAEDTGWLGSVVQLQLGAYGPVRIHLRFFETGMPFGDSGVWTLGGAHVEMQIPGTPEHQVLAWERAEQVVIADLVRSGLLKYAPVQTQLINEAPGFRTIPPQIYGAIPDGLKQMCGLPVGPSDVPVPIPTDGHATILCLEGTAPIVAGTDVEEFTIQFHQTIAKPFCATGSTGAYMVDGPVDLKKSVGVDADGRYAYHYRLSGQLIATPAGGGEPFGVRIFDLQSGFLHGDESLVTAQVKRIAPQDGGAELWMEWLKVGTSGIDQFRNEEHCLTP